MEARPERGTSGEIVPVSAPARLVKRDVPEIVANTRADVAPSSEASAGANPLPASVAKVSEGAGRLDANRRKSRYGVAYLRSICSQAGMPMQENSPDEDVLAVDCDVKFAEAPVLVQLKCTSKLKLTGQTASVALKPDWCTKWAAQKVPVYLVLVVVPKNVGEWLTHQEGGTFHATAAYWVRVYGNEGASVKVPKDQRLSAETFEQWHRELRACFGEAYE